MFQKILVPTDGSEYSRRALESALELATLTNGGIILLHVTYNHESIVEHELCEDHCFESDKLAMSAELVFKATLRSLNTKGIGIKEKILTGHPAAGILEEAERSNADLVVMGAHGHGPFRGAVVGSVAQRVLSHAICPVLIIR